MRHVVLAVIGTPRSGKSTFIQHALDLKRLPSSKISTKKVSLEGIVSVLQIHELNVHKIDTYSDGTPLWRPEHTDEDITDKVDGVVVVYNINDLASTKPIPAVLRIDVSCGSSKRPRALSDIDDLNTTTYSKPVAAESKDRSAQSGNPCMTPEIGRDRCIGEEHMGKEPEGPSGESLHIKTDPASFAGIYEGMQFPLHAATQSMQLGSHDPTSTRPTSPDVAGNEASSTLPIALDRSDLLWLHVSGDKHESAGNTKLESKSDAGKILQDGKKDTGTDFDKLVDRLLLQATSKNDVEFIEIFLCLYRQFCAPSVLLDAIISRFKNPSLGISHPITRTTSQLRYLNVLVQWIKEYPGDFAHSLTRSKMTNFISALAGQRPFAIAIKEVDLHLDGVCEDDDTAWACSDVRTCTKNGVECFGSMSVIRSASSAAQISTEDGARKASSCEKERRASERGTAASSTLSGNDKSSSHSTALSQTLPNAVESAQSQARLLTPFPRTNLCKIHWHTFMGLSDESIAQELTRIDWVLFSSIRSRDLVRHVSLREEDKERCRSLERVSGMINQFNHVAFWIANMILLRDKPKHRAKALEKCMAIAWKLRHLNNYNSLGAVIAGINGTAVHRLAQTRELLPHHAQKQFMRLEILMGTQKSHFAYRLAWSNTTMERIPFLPLHCRDLASAEEGNPTYVDEGCNLINWKKFEIIGDVVISIKRSQAIPYTFTSLNEGAQRLILDSRFVKDDDATASIDAETAMEIQTILQENLEECTVITIAHGLKAVKDADFFVTLVRGGHGLQASVLVTWAKESREHRVLPQIAKRSRPRTRPS
ncbi:MAG: hypothetical protein Q9225_001808 [Loekoesia sp. 1 TL-2023]